MKVTVCRDGFQMADRSVGRTACGARAGLANGRLGFGLRRDRGRQVVKWPTGVSALRRERASGWQMADRSVGPTA